MLANYFLHVKDEISSIILIVLYFLSVIITFYSLTAPNKMAVHPESGSIRGFFPLKGSFVLATVALVLAPGGSPWRNVEFRTNFRYPPLVTDLT